MRRFALLIFIVIGLGVTSSAPWRSAKNRAVKCPTGDCFPVVPAAPVSTVDYGHASVGR